MPLNTPSVNSFQSIKETYETMLAYQWEYMPVVDGSLLYGIVSLKDLGKDVMKSFEDAKSENEIMIRYIHGGESYAIADYQD
jgi:predicted transcriptional regulator